MRLWDTLLVIGATWLLKLLPCHQQGSLKVLCMLMVVSLAAEAAPFSSAVFAESALHVDGYV